MKQWAIVPAGLALVSSFAASPSHAFGMSGGGGRVGFLSPDAGDGGVAPGAHIEFEQAGSQWHVQPNVL